MFVLENLLYPFKDERELISSIEEISSKFTTDRDRIEDYLKSPRLVSAYAAFYLTTNLPKLKSVFEWMPQAWLHELKECDFIDLGAGPGTFSLAWQEWGGQELTGEIIQVEKSPLMREQALKIWQGNFPGKTLHQMSVWKERPENRKRFLLFGHSANEMGAQEALRTIEMIRPSHVLFIEPGTKEFFPEMLAIRGALIKKGFNILFPCPSSHDCPMQGTSDWCHQFIQVRHEASVERLSQMLRKDRRLLPMTVQAFSETYQNHESSQRLVRVHPSTKFSLEWEVCEGRKVERYQIMKKTFEKSDIKKIDSVLSGAAVELETEKELEDRKRGRLLTLNNRPLKP